MSFAITTGTTSWRRVSGPGDVLDGEVYATAIPTHGVWDDALQTIRAPNAQETLDNRRVAVIEQINAERNRREQTGFPYLGKQIDSDPVSVQRITVATNTAQMALAAGVPYEVQWACADNSILTLDAMGVLGMMQALGSYGLALHMYSRGLKAAVLASEDPESIDIQTGWPE